MIVTILRLFTPLIPPPPTQNFPIIWYIGAQGVQVFAKDTKAD